MNRRTMIGGMMAAMATPAALQAQGVDGWAAWCERSKRYTLAIAEAMQGGRGPAMQGWTCC